MRSASRKTSRRENSHAERGNPVITQRAHEPAKAKAPSPHVCEDSGPSKKIRQRPTLPRGFPRSTIGSGGLNFRVRDGNGWDPSDIATGKHVTRTYKG